METKNIAILTSGGDSQGMNTAVNIIVTVANQKKIKVFGVLEGYKGLYEDKFINLSSKEVENITFLGGTILKTARFPKFKDVEVLGKAIENLKKHNIDVLIVLGGDGSYRGAMELVDMGVNVICVPATIDNDLRYTDKCLGFDTAVNNACNYIENVKQTMSALNRGVIFETMGRYCGDIALYSACATASDVVAVPEKPITEEEFISKIKENALKRKKPPIVVVAEKMFDIEKISEILSKETNFEFKSSVVGYIQRGGSPSMGDKILAMQFGVKVIELVSKGVFNVAVGLKNNKIIEVKLNDALHCEYNFNYELLNLFYLLNN